MAIEVPEGWATFLKTLTGMPFPQANEDSLRLVSDDYRLMAEKFQEVEELLRQVVSRVDEDFEGQTATEFVAYARQFVERTNGNQSILDRAYEDALKLSKNAHKTAADIEYTKWMIFGQLALLVVQIALAQALMSVTAGLSEIWAAAAIGAFKAMALLILKFLVAQIIMQTITGLVGGLLLDSILQLTQMGRGDRTEWNTDFTKDAAKFAVIGGVLGGPFALLGGAFGKLLGNLGGKGLGKILGNDAGNVLAKGLAGGGKGVGAGAGKGGGALGKGAGAGAGRGAGGAGAAAGKGAGGAGAAAGKGTGGAGAAAGKGTGGAGAAAGKGAGGLGEGVGKGVSGVGDGAAGAGGRSGAGAAGNTISETSARELGERLGNIMGRTNESLNQLGADGVRGAAAGAVGREVVKDFANAFEKHLGGALGNETAKNLGREYGEALVKNWAGKADWQGLTHALDDALKPFVKDLGESGVRALSHDLPGSFVRTVGGNLGFHVGNFVGEIAGDSAHAVVTEGMYNLIFGPDHTFTVSGWTAAAGAAGGIMGRGVAHGFQSMHNLVQGPPAAPPPRPPAFSSDAPAPSAPAPRPSTESGPTVRDGSTTPKDDADNRTLTDSGSETDSLYYLDVDDLSDNGTLYAKDDDGSGDAAPTGLPTASAPSFATSSDGADFTSGGDSTSGPNRSDTSHGNDAPHGNDSPSGNDGPAGGDGRYGNDVPGGNETPSGNGRPNTTDNSGSGGGTDTAPGAGPGEPSGPRSPAPEPSVPPGTVSELDLLLNSLPDVPDAPPISQPDPEPVPGRAPEDVTQDLTDLDSVPADLPDVPDTTPGTAPDPDHLLAGLPDVPDTPLGPVLTPQEQRLLADLPPVPQNSPAQPSGDGPGASSSGSRTGGSESGNRTPNDPDQLLRERLDRLKNQQDADPSGADLAARLAKLREGGSDDLGRPARVDELREQYRAALDEEGTDGPDRDGTALPYNATGGAAAPPRPVPTVSATSNSGNGNSSSRPQTPTGADPGGLDAPLPDVPQGPPGSRPAPADGTDLVLPDVPRHEPGARPGTGRTESDGTGTDTDDPSSPPRTESADELPFPGGFDDGGELDALLARLDGTGVLTDDPVSRLADLPDVPDALSSAEQRRLAADVTRETDALLADARRVGVDRETRQRLGERIQDDVRAGRHADAAEGLRELSDLVALHGLGERLQQFRRHMDGGYEGRAAQLGMRRTEWLRHALGIEEAALNGDPRRTTRLLDDFEQRLGALGAELKDRADHSPEALEKRIADSRRADAEDAGMDRERIRAWEDRLEQAATPEEHHRLQVEYAAEKEATRRLAELRELGASEAELASWKSRFEGPGRGPDLDAQYERRTAALSREADLAALQGRLDALREGGPQREPAQPPPPAQGGTGDASPTGGRSDDSGPAPDTDAANDLADLDARLDRLFGGEDHAGMSREEQRQWADRHARAEDDAARQEVERAHADRMAQVERERRLSTVADGGPEGARRGPDRREAWQSRLDAAADDPQALDRVLDDYDAETEQLRREGKERLEQELRAPDRLRDLDRRIDRSLDRLPEEVRARAARDARTLVERLRDLAAVTEEAPAPKADDAVPEKDADARDTQLPRPTSVPEPTPVPHRAPDPAPASAPSPDALSDSPSSPAPSSDSSPAPTRSPSPSPSTSSSSSPASSSSSSSASSSRTNAGEGGGGDGGTPRPAGSERSRRGSVSSDDQVMEAPRQRNDARASEDRDDLSTHTRDHDELSERENRRVPTETEDDALPSSTSQRDGDAPHLSDDAESTASAPKDPENTETSESAADSGRPEHAGGPENTGNSKNPENPESPESTGGPAQGKGASQDGDGSQDAPSGNAHRPGGPSEERQPGLSARDTALNALSADEFEQRVYRARRDRPDLTSDEALRDEVYRRINDPGVKVEKEVSLAAPLLTEGVEPPPSGRSGTFVTFDDQAMLPASLRGHGHGHLTLRGVDRLVDALTMRWRLHPDGIEQVRLVLTQSPHTLLGPRTFVLPTLDGGHREVTLSLDSYGDWRRFAEPTPLAVPDDEAQPVPATGEDGSPTVTTTPKPSPAPAPASPAEGSGAATAPKTDATPTPKTDTTTTPRTDTSATTPKTVEVTSDATAPKTDASDSDAVKAAEDETAADAPVKVETELRTRPGTTETKTLGTSRAFGLAVPISATGTPFGALGSVSLSGRRMEASYTYTQENRAQTSVTTVGKDGSHLHVSDLHIVAESVRVWDKKGRELPADRQQPGTAGRQHYRIRDGVAWRVPDSVTDPAIPDRLPTAFTFAPGARPHLLAPLSVTTRTRLLDWALRNFPEAVPGSFLRRQLADLFGEESLRTMIAQSSGETVVTAPLFAGLGGRSLGSVELRLVPVDATLLQASDKTEVKKADAQRSTGTTEKKNTQGIGIGLTAGPQFGLIPGSNALNLQIAGAVGLTTQRAESSYSGNTAESVRTLNSRGHSGLYGVRFRLEVRRQGGTWESPAPNRREDPARGGAPAEDDTFLTATVQLPRADARRLAGWDDGTAPVPDAEAPPAPAYLTPSNPATFGLHAVVDLAPVGDAQAPPPHTSLTDALVDRIQAGLHRAYPDLVLPPGTNTAPADARPGGGDRTYNNAVRNTHLLRQALARTVLEGSLDRLTSTGLRIQLEQLGTLNKRYVVVTVRAQATDRRFLGTHHDLGLANSVLSTRRADSATTRTHGWSIGFDAGLTGLDRFGGSGSIGYRYGKQTAYGMTYGPTLTPDGGITSAGSQHLWSYHLDFTAEATSFTRPRQTARTMSGELLGTRWFVKQDAGTVDLLRTGQTGQTGQTGATARPPVAGRVTLAVPASLSVPSALTVDPPRTAPAATPMTPAMAELLSSGKPVPTGAWTSHPLLEGLHSVQSVTSPQLVQQHLRELLATVSGGSWVYGNDGTPASGALAEAFAVGRNEADFSDAAQTGKHVSDLFGRTAVTDITASVSAWPQLRRPHVVAVVDSSDLALSAVGSGTSGAGHSVAGVASHTVSLLGAFRAKHTDTFQTAGLYGATWTPYQRTSTTTEAATFSANPAHTVQYTGPMALVSADVAWHLAARSQPSGLLQGPMELARGRKPAGRIVEVPDGVLVWVPLVEARKAGLFDDGLTPPPPTRLYAPTGAAAHGTLTVGRIDMAAAIEAFTDRLLTTLPQHKSWLGPKSLLADQLGGLARQMTALSPSGMRALQTGMENGGTSLRLARNKIGPSKDASLTVTLRRTGFTPGPLRHDVKPTIARPTSTAETATQKLARGYEAGYRLSEVPGVQNDPVVRNGGFTLDDKAGSSRSASLAHAVTDAVSAQVAFEGPVVTGRTTFEATFTLELPDGTVVTHTQSVGDAEVVLPLSLARPGTTTAPTATGTTAAGAAPATTGASATTTASGAAGATATTAATPATASAGTSASSAVRQAPRPMLLPPRQPGATASRDLGSAGRKLFAAGPESVVVTTVGGITVLRDAAAYALDTAVKGRGTKSGGATPMPTDAHGRYVRKTALTRPGTAAGEALKGGISTDVLSAYLPQMIRDHLTLTLHDTTSTVGGTDAVLTLSADIDLSQAELLAVDAQAGLGGSRRTSENDTYTGDTTDSHAPAMTVGPGYQSQPLVQSTAAVPGWADSDAAGSAADRRTSALTTLKPFAGGAVLVQAPLRVVQTAKASHRVADLPIVPAPLRPGSRPPVTVEHTVPGGVTMWVSFDVAKKHGLLPPEVETAAGVVKEQTEKYVEAAKEAGTAERRLRALDSEVAALRSRLRELLRTQPLPGTEVAAAREHLAAARTRYAEAQRDLANHRRDLATAEQHLAEASEAAWQAVEHYTLTGPRPAGTPPASWTAPDTTASTTTGSAATSGEHPATVPGYPPLSELLADSTPHTGPSGGPTATSATATPQDVHARTEFWLGETGPLPGGEAVRREQAKAAAWAEHLRAADAAYRASVEAVRAARQELDAALLREARSGKTAARDASPERFDALGADVRTARTAYDKAVERLTAHYRELGLVRAGFDAVDTAVRPLLAPRPENSAPLVVTPWHPAPEPEGYVRPTDTPAPDPYTSQGEDAEGRPVTLTDPEGRVLQLLEPPSTGPAHLDRGTSFHRSLLDAVERAHPGLLAGLGLHAAGRDFSAADVQHLRQRLADRLAADRDELGPFLAIDPQERFTAQELADAGIVLTPAEAAEHTASRHRLPDTVAARLTPGQRLELARTTLLRPGDQQIGDRNDAGWNHSAGDLAALLAARVLGVPVTVVHADLNHLTFTPAGTGTAGSVRSGVVLHLADGLYRPAVPDTTDPLLLNAAPETTEQRAQADTEITGQRDQAEPETTEQPAGAAPAESGSTAPPRSEGPTYYMGSGSGPLSPVPKQINFIWLGGELTPAARANIERWGAKARAAQWKLTIWTDTAAARNNEAFLQESAETGVAQHGKVKSLFAKDKVPLWQKNPLSKAQTLYEAALDLQSFAMASDVARYALLHKHGGVYLDVDLGPGAVNLRPEGVMMPMGDDTLPMFGPLLQDLGSVQKKLKLPEGSVPTPEQIQQAAEMAYEDGDFGNHFIIAHPGSAFMEQVLGNLPDYNVKDKLTKGYLVAAMKSKNVASKTGPLFLVRQFMEHATKFPAPEAAAVSGDAPAAESDRAAGKKKFASAPHNRYRIRTEDWADWTRLEWLTPESEHQETPTTTSAPARQGTLAKRLGGTLKKLKDVSTWGGGRSGSNPTLPNDGTVLTGFDPAPDRIDPHGGAAKDELVGKDGRKVSFERMRQSLRTIKDASGEVIGYASHSNKDWAPRKDFYANYRAGQDAYLAYRPNGDGTFTAVSGDPAAPRTVPWRTTAGAAGTDTASGQGQKTPGPVFFDAHGSQHGVKLHIDGELPLEVDGAQFARFMETLADPDGPPAPVVLVACDTGTVRSSDGSSVVRDAARAVPGRRWYAPDVAVGHVSKPSGAVGEATGVLALLQDGATGRPGRWVTAGEPDALDALLGQEGGGGDTVVGGGKRSAPGTGPVRSPDELLVNVPDTDTATRQGAESSRTADDGVAPEQKEGFHQQSAQLWDRIEGIEPLAEDTAFRQGVDAWLKTVESDLEMALAGRPGRNEVNESAIAAIMRGFRSDKVMGHQVSYLWFLRQQETGGFEGVLPTRAAASAEHGQIWSKLGPAEAISTANVGTGVALESSVQGYIFDGLGFGLPHWDDSPTMAELWRQLSRTYAQGLTSRVTAHVLDGIHDSSVLTTTEWPEAKKRIESGEIDGLDVVVYTAVPGEERHELKYVETVTVRTQEEFDRLPRVPDTEEWRERQRQVDLEQKDVLKEIYQRELQVNLFSSYAKKALGAQGGEDRTRLRPPRARNNSMTDDGANPGDGPDVLRGADLTLNTLNTLNTESAQIASADPPRLAVGGYQGEATSIPKRLNFIWLGGEMTAAARENLRNWAEKAENSAWDMRVWTDEKGRAANSGFLAELAGHGVASPSVATVFGPKQFFRYTDPVLSRAGNLYEKGQELRSFALASDAARYAILYQQGGVYLDVDVAPGNFVLPADGVQMPSGDNLPMFGPRLRDAASVLGTNPPPDAAITLDAVRAKAVEMYDRGELGNQLIAAHPNNPFLGYLLTELVKLSSLSGLERGIKLDEIKQRQVAHITGPTFIDGRLNDYNRAWMRRNDTASYGETRGAARFRPTEAARNVWIDLAWVTPESENQETASLHGTEQPAEGTLTRSGTMRKKLKKFGDSLTGTFRSSHREGGDDAGSSSGTRKFFSNSRTDSSAGEGPLLHSAASLLASPPAGATPDAVLTGKDGRQVSYGQVYEGLTVIRGADGRTLGYASHSAQDWAPRRDFYAAYRPDEALFAHYRTTENGDFVLDTDSTTDSPAGEVPWRTGAAARDAQEPVTPLFFDAHGTEDGVEFPLAGAQPLVVDGAQLARFIETLRDPARPPAPVVLVACETAKIRSGDGSSVALDAARALPGRLWYAPDTEVGHATPSSGSGGASGVLGLLADPVARRRGAWVAAGEGMAADAVTPPAPRAEAERPPLSLADMIFETLNSASPSSAEQADAAPPAPSDAETGQTEPAPPAQVQAAAVQPALGRPLNITFKEGEGDGATLRELGADDEQGVRAYVITSHVKGDYDAMRLMLHRLGASAPPPPYLEELRALADELMTSSEPAPPVPTQLHFIWLGKDLPADALKNITAWTARARRADWTVNLWTDSRTRLSPTTQMSIRFTKGLTRMQLDPVIHEDFKKVFAIATDPTGGTQAYAFASDLARYSVLKQYGGVYADVDLGPGTFEFSAVEAPRLRQNDVPVLGPLLRDLRGLDGILQEVAAREGVPHVPVAGQPTREQVGRAVGFLLDTGGYGNHFITAQKNAPFIDRLIQKIARTLSMFEDAEEMKQAGAAATGPFLLLQVLNEHLEQEFGVKDPARGEFGHFQGQGKHFHEHLDWLTPESEHQESEHP
ncbi:glycosyltransferase [Streptomyces sp. NPDC018007]|uniref:glycosyltransferase n=1 Tax=Streptomyces sp. NPDC018007 TaxID=3365029 RepID=UPI0037A451B5